MARRSRPFSPQAAQGGRGWRPPGEGKPAQSYFLGGNLRADAAWRGAAIELAKPALANERQTHYSISSMLATAQNLNLAGAMARLDALTDWERRPRGAMRVGLEPMLDLAARLRDPQTSFRSIHVAGTKGKGSVSALIEAALAHGGLRVGRYGSPHVERVTERVSVEGREIDEPALARALN